MNFATLQGLTIPEGVVTQITDASGAVIWSAVEKVTITLTGTAAGSYAEYKGTKYYYPSTFEAAVGDQITMYAGVCPSSATIYLNGQQVASNLAKVTYSYTVVGNTTCVGSMSGSGQSGKININITAVPEGHAVVNITGTGLNNAYKACVLTIDGVAYTSATTLAAPIGTVISCAVATQANGEEPGYVKVNGTNVLSVPMNGNGTYDYTVTGNVTINMSTVRDADKMRTGYITITEIRKDLATITINSEGFNGSYGGSVVVNAPFPSDIMSAMMGVTNNPCTIMTSSTGTWSYDVPAGTTITCTGVTVIVNGTQVSSSTYTVTGDVTLRLYASGFGRNVVEITET